VFVMFGNAQNLREFFFCLVSFRSHILQSGRPPFSPIRVSFINIYNNNVRICLNSRGGSFAIVKFYGRLGRSVLVAVRFCIWCIPNCIIIIIITVIIGCRNRTMAIVCTRALAAYLYINAIRHATALPLAVDQIIFVVSYNTCNQT